MDDMKLYWNLTGAYRQALEKDKKKGVKTLLWVVPIGLVIGVALGLLENSFLSDYIEAPSFTVLLLWIFLTILVEVAIHEAGHLVCGLVSGYRFVSYRILSFAFYKKEGKIRFGRYAIPGTAGQCLMTPPCEDAEEVPYRLYNLGGVLFDLLSAAITLTLCLLIPSKTMRLLFGISCMFALVSAACNGVPFLSAGQNDGKNLMDMNRSAAAREAFCRQLFLMEAMAQGIRYKDMPERLFPVYIGEGTAPLMQSQTHMTVQRMMEKGELAEAKALILRFLTETPNILSAYYTACLFDLWYLEMMGEHRREVVELLKSELADNCKKQKNSVQVIRCTLTYQYLFVGNLQEINAARARFDRLGKSYVFKGDLAFENELIDNAKAIYDAWADGKQ